MESDLGDLGTKVSSGLQIETAVRLASATKHLSK
jgi:hypothetical protein